MIEAFCRKITDLWCRQNVIDRIDAEVYRYGLELLISTVINFFIVILLSIFLNKPLRWIPYLAAFIPCRVFGGGYHAKTHWGCSLFTASLFLSVMWCVDRVPLAWIPNVCVCAAVLALAIQLWLAPIAADNKPLTVSERKCYRLVTLSLGAIILLLTVIFKVVQGVVSPRTMMTFVGGECAMVVSMMIGYLSAVKKRTTTNAQLS